MSKEGASIVSYMVAITEMKDGPNGPTEGPVQVVETCNSLITANTLKVQAFMRPTTWRAWVERLEQKRIGEIMDRGKANAAPQR